MPGRILVVDDSVLAREMLTSALKKNNYNVDTASNGRECFKLLSRNDYDLAIIDYLMPDTDGLELLKSISKNQIDVPVVILTSGGSESVAVQAMKFGALDYVVKSEEYCENIIKILKEDLSLYKMARKKYSDVINKRKLAGKKKKKIFSDKERILVVDDSILVREMLQQTLTQNDYDVDLACGGLETLKMIKEKDYDLAIVDYLMPGMNGLQVLQKIKEKGYGVPVIIFTGKGSEKIAVQAMKLGALDYVVKAIGDMEFLPRVIKENLYICRAEQHIERESSESNLFKLKEKILVVDDSQQARNMTKKMLISLNYDVDVASGGVDALKMIKEKDYDLAIVDYLMPGMNGLEILENVVKKGHDVPVIVFTGRGSEEIAVQAMKLGALDYVVKTVGYLELLSKIVQRNLKNHRINKEKKSLEKKLKIKNSDLEKRIIQLRALNEISKSIGGQLDLNRTLTVIVSRISELLHCNRITVMLLDDKKKHLSIRAAKGFPEKEAKKVKVKVGDSISGYVAKTKEALFSRDIEQDSRFKKISSEQYFNKSLLSVPLKIREDIMGVINVNNKRNNELFTIDDRDILMTIAYNAAIAIENSRRYEKAQKDAVTDSLTKLYNQRYFFNALDIEVERAKRYKTKLSLIIIDIDNFKEVNDKYGHQQGDRVLANIARMFAKSIRKPAVLARYGGEEFAIIVPQTDIKGASMLAERLRVRIEKHSFLLKKSKRVKLTISLGVSEYKKGISAKKLVGNTDKALYKAKKKGKNTYMILK
ncbi:MAG: response regulator [Candidatus Aureabacteria bacterium]|nr:response regulator [Candidatus Auribacterota bacterium]